MKRGMQGQTEPLTEEPAEIAISLPQRRPSVSRRPRSYRKDAKAARARLRFSDLSIDRDEADDESGDGSLDDDEDEEDLWEVPTVWRVRDSRSSWERQHWSSAKERLPHGIYYARYDDATIHGLSILKEGALPCPADQYRVRTAFSDEVQSMGVAEVNGMVGDMHARFWSEQAVKKLPDVRRGLLAPAPFA
jgi:hypothetical protein